MIVALLIGLACGFIGSIPIAGPAAVLVVQRSLDGHARAALFCGVGTAIAEAGYAVLAFLGMTAALAEFPWLLPASRVLGAVILVALGLYFALARRKHPEGQAPPQRRGRDGFVVGLAVTALNPTLLATWSAVVTVLHSAGFLRIEPLDAFPFGLGVGAGVAGWFAVLVELIRLLRGKLQESTLDTVVRVIGWVLVAAGGALIVKLALTGLSGA